MINSKVNELTQYFFSFNSEVPIKAGNCIFIQFPSQVRIADSNNCIGNYIGISKNSSCLIKNNQVNITNAFINDYGTGSIQFGVDNVTNPGIVKPTDAFLIEIYSSNSFLYKISTDSTTFIEPTPGTLLFSITPADYTTGNTTNYDFNLTILNKIPAKGIISITLPIEIFFNLSFCSDFLFFPSIPSCIFNNRSVNITNGLNGSFSGTLMFKINSLVNPASTKPSSSFQIMTYTEDFLIDLVNSSACVTMNSLHNLVYSKISVDTSIVGVSANYNMSITPFNKIPSKGYLQITPPIGMNFNDSIVCVGANLVSYSVISGILYIYIQTAVINTSVFSVLIGKIDNPKSTKPVVFTVTTKDTNNYSIDQSFVTFQINTPSNFTSVVVVSNSSYINTLATYEINYLVSNPIPDTGYIEILLSFINAQVSCLLNSQAISCDYNEKLLLYGSFPNTGVISLENIKNPVISETYKLSITSKTFDGFLIDYYQAALIIVCQSPCLTCENTANNCLSCIPSSNTPYY